MKDSDVFGVDEPRLSLADQFYVPQVLKGLGTTMKHMFRVLGGRDRVVQYPEEKREDVPVEDGGMFRPTYKGVHRLNKDEEGRVKCVACFMCSTACPARCIHIEAAESPWPDREKYPAKFDIDELRCIYIEADESPWPDREKYPAKFDIDELRCIYCGMCEEACPVDAIELTSTYDIVGLTRQEMIFDKSKLLRIFDQTVKAEPM